MHNLIDEARDKVELQGVTNPLKGPALLGLVNAVKLCWIRFDVWPKLNADGKASGKLDLTSLKGSDMKAMLERLPDKLIAAGVLIDNSAQEVVEVWKVNIEKQSRE